MHGLTGEVSEVHRFVTNHLIMLAMSNNPYSYTIHFLRKYFFILSDILASQITPFGYMMTQTMHVGSDHMLL